MLLDSRASPLVRREIEAATAAELPLSQFSRTIFRRRALPAPDRLEPDPIELQCIVQVVSNPVESLGAGDAARIGGLGSLN